MLSRLSQALRPASGLVQRLGLTSTISKASFSSDSGSLDQQFTALVAKSSKLKSDPGNEAKLKLYALYKQATVGANNTPKPGKFDIVGKYKYEAWSQLGSMSKDDAKQNYVNEVNRLISEIGLQE